MERFYKPLILLALVLGVLYYFNSNEADSEPEQAISKSEEVTRESSTLDVSKQPPVVNQNPSNQNSIQQVSPQDAASGDPCEDKLGEIESSVLNKIATETTPAERETLFTLTGWDWVSLQELQGVSLANRSDWLNAVKEKQLMLLREKIDNGASPLYLQQYLLECVTNDIPKYCQPDELERIALEDSDNINVWLLLIHYYNNRSDDGTIAELINSAASATVLENYTNEYIKSVYDELLSLTNSPAYSAGFASSYRNWQIFGLESLQRVCSNTENVNCFQIGENLERYGNQIITKRTGILIQLDYLTKTNQGASIEIKKEQLAELDAQIEAYIKNFKMPYDDDMAYYMIEALEIRDELQYYEKISQEAQRILEEKPELCTW